LFELAFAEIGGDVGRIASLGESANDFGPGRFGETGQLFQLFVVVGVVREKNADQNGRLAFDALIAF
jgi:hypothetical protein